MSGLFISASGILNAFQRQRVTANNIANLNTPGFQASRLLSTPTPGGGVQVGAITRDQSQGALQTTGNPLDLATAQGYFRVEGPGGAQAYTRDGRFGLNANGEVVTADGSRLIPPVQVPAGATSVAVTQDGRVFATVAGQDAPVPAGQFEVFTFTNPQGLQAIGGGQYTATDASGAAIPAASLSLYAGVLQGSNAGLATEQVGLLLDTRYAQANVNAFRAQDELLGELLDLQG
ncbi:MAG: flagellar hook-basal body protein [Candidatus Hydrogenedentes bacterium]|nr:flagellar hook-basal body protein [Candidatus Hydrogenedentota bacterium]